MTSIARDDRAIVMSQGSRFAGGSIMSRDNATTIVDAAGVKKTADGLPIASVKMFANVPVIKKSDGFSAFVTILGAGPQLFALHPEMKLTEGRMFKPAVHEFIVGRSARAQYEGLNVGDVVALPQGDWTVVGVYASASPTGESSLIADVDTLLSAFQRTNYNTVDVLLESAAAFDQFKAALTTNPTLTVDVKRDSELAAESAKPLNDFLGFIAIALGGIMSTGAIFGALNTMYAAVSARRREIATLRAIGFGAAPVVISVLTEALTLAALGAAIGGALSWVAFNGNSKTLGGTVFQLAVTPKLLIGAVAVAGVVGLIGGLFPALRAARLPIVDALRAR
jgi:putative ABC transport system permease protein